jgi:uncharacterized membrane protein YfcA
MGLPAPQTVVVAAVVAAAGLVRGFSGFGAGLVMAPLLPLLMGPTRAVPLMVLLDLVASAQLLPGAVREAAWREVGPIGITACLAVPVGGLALTTADPALFRRLVASGVVAFVLVLMSGWRLARRPPRAAGLGAGAVGGFLAGFAGIGGPPVILYQLSGPDPAHRSRANLISYIAITQLVAVTAFAARDLLDRRLLFLAAGLAPVFAAAILGGERLFRSAGESRRRGAVLWLLLAVGALGLALGSAGR